jgi:predicted dinucleotide-binding enzyme
VKIAVIASGKIGSTAARLFLEADHDVVIANRRGPGSLAARRLQQPDGALYNVELTPRQARERLAAR